MIRGPQRCTRTDTLLPDTTLFRCRRGTVEGRRAGPGGDSGLRVRGRAAAGDRSCNLSSGYGFEQTVSSAWLNAGGYNSGPCIPPGSMSCMWYAIEGHRSEEHTSELQSLLRNSYAVFCFKKQNININTI